MAHSPLEQFKVKPLVKLDVAGFDISFTNSSLMLLLVFGFVTFFFTFGLRKTSLIPNRFQATIELAYDFIANMLKENVGDAGKKYFPFVFSIFLLVLGCNLVGMLPYSFTVTSHIIATFALALFAFIIVNIIGFARHGLHYFHLFVPQGVPAYMLPLITPIELISYLIRPVSLGIRLAAAMTAGHIVMKIFAGFIISLASITLVLGVVPFAFAIALVGLELLVGFIQAFIFSILICIYLNDAVNMH
ncbi:MAG: F0F1 ATP synthase subunit A [Rickettsiales bacterium]|nr:F0F1 ATP synthase subunit A [Rickettsiales bacterium]